MLLHTQPPDTDSLRSTSTPCMQRLQWTSPPMNDEGRGSRIHRAAARSAALLWQTARLLMLHAYGPKHLLPESYIHQIYIDIILVLINQSINRWLVFNRNRSTYHVQYHLLRGSAKQIVKDALGSLRQQGNVSTSQLPNHLSMAESTKVLCPRKSVSSKMQKNYFHVVNH